MAMSLEKELNFFVKIKKNSWYDIVEMCEFSINYVNVSLSVGYL